MSKKLTKLEKHLIKQELERLRKEDKQHFDFIRDHEKMYSRRDFMGVSVLSGYSMLALPGILSLLSNKVHAQDMEKKCGANDTSAANVFAGNFHIELAGGACLGGAFIPYTKSGAKLTDAGYEKFGYSPAINANKAPGKVSSDFGADIHTDSSFYKGLMQAFADNDIDVEELKGKLKFVSVIARSENDNSSTPSSCGNLIREIAGAGKLTELVGSSSTVNGIRSRSAGNINKYSSTPISSPASVAGLVDLGVIAQNLNEAEAKKILKAAEKMSARRLASFKQQTVSDQLKTLIECGYYKANATVFGNDITQISPAGDAMYTGIFGNDFQKAAITKLVLRGNARSGGIVLGGYDYHNGLNAGNDRSGHNKRFDAALVVGKIIAAAVKEGKSFTMQITTDGSASCRGGAPTANSAVSGAGFYANRVEDASTGGEQLVAYSPNGFKEEFSGHQIGGYTSAGAIDLSANAISNNQTAKSIAMAANFLSMHGKSKVSDIEAVCKKLGLNNPFKDQATLDSVLVLKEKA